jgi:hypothetical protein
VSRYPGNYRWYEYVINEPVLGLILLAGLLYLAWRIR